MDKKQLNDETDLTALELARMLEPRMRKAVRGFHRELEISICQYLVDQGRFKRLTRLRGSLPTDRLNSVEMVMDMATQHYEKEMMDGLLQFVLWGGRLKIPNFDPGPICLWVEQMLDENEERNTKNEKDNYKF